jgi:hypothetical protein
MQQQKFWQIPLLAELVLPATSMWCTVLVLCAASFYAFFAFEPYVLIFGV